MENAILIINEIRNDPATIRVLIGHLTKKIHYLYVRFDLGECAAWAQVGITHALNEFDVSRVGGNRDKDFIYRYIINTGLRRAIDSMRGAGVVGRAADEREVIDLRYNKGLGYREIAAKMGITTTRVYILHAEAMKKIHQVAA